MRPVGGCTRPQAAGAGSADVVTVSVIVPAYNAGAWLERCLTSVLEQDCRAFELIVVNDGSTDCTGSIIDAFAARDSRVRAIHQPNRGVSLARQAGLEAARGEWIQFLDADDELLPGALGALVAKAEATGADIVAVPFFYCREGGVRERSVGPESTGCPVRSISEKCFAGGPAGRCGAISSARICIRRISGCFPGSPSARICC